MIYRFIKNKFNHRFSFWVNTKSLKDMSEQKIILREGLSESSSIRTYDSIPGGTSIRTTLHLSTPLGQYCLQGQVRHGDFSINFETG
ncbi:hypothetical protein CDAR_114721 [Caerostris darwini]|uniref:Uncharacterized protein n=1 Tax=Caerostris darwini TaxID=1538125 RepID=A0AAV4MFS4_9ARAC|nr:hypothetical protein CDAR_114721 [Caerostris darwini]